MEIQNYFFYRGNSVQQARTRSRGISVRWSPVVWSNTAVLKGPRLPLEFLTRHTIARAPITMPASRLLHDRSSANARVCRHDLQVWIASGARRISRGSGTVHVGRKSRILHRSPPLFHCLFYAASGKIKVVDRDSHISAPTGQSRNSGCHAVIRYGTTVSPNARDA